jgi:hypothetical protein
VKNGRVTKHLLTAGKIIYLTLWSNSMTRTSASLPIQASILRCFNDGSLLIYFLLSLHRLRVPILKKKQFPLAGQYYICTNEKPTLYLLTAESQLVTHNRKLQHTCTNEKRTLYLLTEETQLITHITMLHQVKPHFFSACPSW